MTGGIALTFFVISLFVIVPFLYYYRNKNPNPRFRPKFGEMVLVTLLSLGLAGGASMFIAGLMGLDPDDVMGEFDPGGRGKSGPDDEEGMFSSDDDGGDDPLGGLLGD